MDKADRRTDSSTAQTLPPSTRARVDGRVPVVDRRNEPLTGDLDEQHSPDHRPHESDHDWAGDELEAPSSEDGFWKKKRATFLLDFEECISSVVGERADCRANPNGGSWLFPRPLADYCKPLCKPITSSNRRYKIP